MLLDRYIGATVLRGFALIAAGLTALFGLLVFVEQLGLVGQGRYGLADALGYAVLTAPDRLLQLAPVCMLLAVLLGLGRLARGCELTGFRSFGVSEARIVGAVLKLCLPIVLALFLIAQFVIPPAQMRAERLQAAALGDAPGLAGFWAERNGEFLNVRRLDGDTLQGVRLYRFNADGTLSCFIQAAQARMTPGGWVLRDVLRKRVENGEIETDHPARLNWRPLLSARDLRIMAMPESLPPVALFFALRAGRQPAIDARRFWSLVAIPFSLAGMTLIAAPFLFGPPRSGAGQLVIGGLLGMAFMLGQQITGYLGLLWGGSQAVPALAPSALLLAAGLWLLARGGDLIRY